MLRALILKIIRLYQATLSFDHGWLKHRFPFGFCPYTPSCSEYGYQAIKHKGVIRGSFLATGRVLRCHPFTKGGFDPVPGVHEKYQSRPR